MTQQPGEASGPVYIVVPTYNERDNVPVVVGALLDLPEPDIVVLIVDDNSPDGTGDVADALAEKQSGRVAVLHRREKQGLGRAYVAGMGEALDRGAAIVVQMDADLSHPVTTVPVMIDAIRRRGADVVIGSRYVPGGSTADNWPLRRRLLSSAANVYVNAVLRLKIHDATAGFKAWRAETLRELDLSAVGSNGYAFQIEMNFRARALGARVVETPIHFEDRTEGTSKMSAAVQREAAIVPWRLLRGSRGSRKRERVPTA